jgi:hypothetical protein
MSRKENDGDATKKKKKKEKKYNRYLLMRKMYTNVKNEAHQNDPQLRMPCKKSNAYLFICLFLK